MGLKKVSSIVILFFLFFQSSIAQPSGTGDWYMYFGNQSINERWNVHSELQYRNYNVIGNLEQLLIRGGIGYNLSEKNNNLMLGYAYVYSEPYVDANTKTKSNENRIFQQFITRQRVSRVNLQHRYRLEQRFLEDDYKTRFRYFLGLTIPINATEVKKQSFYLSAYNEVFVHATSENAFDRNRIYGALGYSISNYLRVEAGVMTQVFETGNRKQFQIAIYNNLPF